MNALLGWLTSLRRTEPATSTEISRRHATLRQQHHETTTARDRTALDAVNDHGAAERWQRLNETALELEQRMQVLAAALPTAEAREAEAARQAEAIVRAKRMQDYERATAEAQAWLDTVLARLPDGATLTAARDWRDRLHNEARGLRAWSHDVRVRRPVDPLEGIYDALGHRIQRVERARWAKSAPITLLDETPKAS